MRIPVTDLLSIQEEQDKEKRYGPVVVSLIQITRLRLRPNRVCFLRLATLPMPRGQGHATDVGAHGPRASIWHALAFAWATHMLAGGRQQRRQAGSREYTGAANKVRARKTAAHVETQGSGLSYWRKDVLAIDLIETISPLIIDQAVMTILFQLTIYYLGALLVSRHRILANIAFLFAKRGETWSGDTWSQRTPVHARRAADFRLHKAHARACRRTHAGSPTSACTGHGLAHQLRGPRRPCLVVPSSRNRQASGR